MGLSAVYECGIPGRTHLPFEYLMFLDEVSHVKNALGYNIFDLNNHF